MPVVNMHASKGEITDTANQCRAWLCLCFLAHNDWQLHLQKKTCSFAVELQVFYNIFDPTVLDSIARIDDPMSWRVLMVAEIAGGSPRFLALS